MTAVADIKRLDAREHILKYPDAFLGSTLKSNVPRMGYHPTEGFKNVTNYSSASIRCFKEAIDNSVDASIRIQFKKGTKIHVSFNQTGFSVEDDGHGIPIKYSDKEKMWMPQLALAHERAGSNFEVTNRSTIGMYGVGIFCVNVVSDYIQLITCDGTQIYSQLFQEGCSKISKPDIQPTKNPSGTYVEVKLNTKIIQWTMADICCCLQIINNIMFVYPEITITADVYDKPVELLPGDKYIEALGIDPWFTVGSTAIRGVFGFFDEKSEVRGLVNGTECSGIHVSTFKSIISAELLPIISKEIEDVTRGDISTVISGLLSFRILNPAFGGLTKTELTGCDLDDLKKSISEILPRLMRELADCDPFKTALDAVISKRLNKKLKNKERKAAKSRKSLKLVDVYNRTGKKEETYLLITEGDSAKGLFLQARDPAKHAIYPLRGKILNSVAADDVDTVTANKVLFELATILGLSVTDPDIRPCRYDYVVSLTDADHDGDSIVGLLAGFLFQYWPKLFDERKVLRLCTPSHIEVNSKNRRHFYKGEIPPNITGKLEYIKGLGSLSLEDTQHILANPTFEILNADPLAAQTIELVLGTSAERKREWLAQ